MRRMLLAGACLCLVPMLGCDTPDSAKQSKSTTTESTGSANKKKDETVKQDTEKAAVNDGDNQTIDGMSTTSFGADLLSQLEQQGQTNAIVSPYSLASALGMIAVGARGETRAEILEVLGANDELPSKFSELQSSLTSGAESESDHVGEKTIDDPGTTPTFETANALWLQKGFDAKDSFVETLKSVFGATTETLDFRSADDAAKTINSWVADETADMITELVSPGMFGRRTRVVLTNAIYFEGSWATPFDENKTKPGSFTTSGGEETEVPMMRRTDEMQYLAPEGSPVRGVRLPYSDGDYELTLLLPEAGERDAVASAFDASRLDGWLEETTRKRVNLRLPTFSAQFKFRAEKTLQDLGIERAFSPDTADFTGIHDTAELFVDAVVHRTRLTVDEKGTEAAAASAGTIGITGGMLDAEPVELHFDRPFLLLLRHRPTDTLLFTGWIDDPA